MFKRKVMAIIFGVTISIQLSINGEPVKVENIMVDISHLNWCDQAVCPPGMGQRMPESVDPENIIFENDGNYDVIIRATTDGEVVPSGIAGAIYRLQQVTGLR